ncbi:MAG: SDR family oxidoreductase [Bacteroidota bacterium]
MNAIITGATKGIGKALVMHLAANNYNLALCARNADDIENLIAELKTLYPEQRFFGEATDLEKRSEVEAFAESALGKLITVDLLINNAGLFLPSGLMDEAPDALERQMQVNVHTPHYLCKFFAKEMVSRKRGHIVNICSTASLNLLTGSASYSISKAALLSLTRLLREELIPSGIRVTAVLPGATLTDSWAGTTIPADRFVLPEDVAKAVFNAISMSEGANVDEIIIRPLLGS